MIHKDIVYWQKGDLINFDDDWAFSIIAKPGPEQFSLLQHEIDNVGIGEVMENEEFLNFWKRMPNGYYEITYESFTDSEYCDGYKMYDYQVFGNLLHVEPSFKAKILDKYVYRWMQRYYNFIDLFLPIWSVDFEYGGAGMTKSKLSLPKALWVRLVRPKKYAKDLWGENFTRIELRKGY